MVKEHKKVGLFQNLLLPGTHGPVASLGEWHSKYISFPTHVLPIYFSSLRSITVMRGINNGILFSMWSACKQE